MVVKSDEVSLAIKQRLIDASVPSAPLACQMSQVEKISILLWLYITVSVPTDRLCMSQMVSGCNF